ncbi:MAG TPA: biotin/lipoyl-containing protein, partial [Arenibaculum sp.]|nr:biotin/lipoyl-containing protein [Arenibaculum sp.]
AAAARATAAASGDPFSPWAHSDGWRLNDDAHETLVFRDMVFQDAAAAPGGTEHTVDLIYLRDGYRLRIDGREIVARGELGPDGTLEADLDGARIRATIVRRDTELSVFRHGGVHRLGVVEPLAGADAGDAPGSRLTAPMPGRIIAVLVEAGAVVSKGQPLIVLEAMKMEHTIKAPADGTVEAVRYGVGDQVEDGAELIGFEAAEVA